MERQTDMLDVALGDPATSAFLAVLIALFIGLLVPLHRRRRSDSQRDRMLVQIAPSLLATLGVFGTFLGIFIGLLGFDVTAIDESVPALLAGLRTAFLTSLMGMGLSVVYRLVTAAMPARPPRRDERLSNTLRDLLEEQRRGRQDVVLAVEALRTSIVDDGGTLSDRLDRFGRIVTERSDESEARMAARADSLEAVVKTCFANRQTQAKALHDEQLTEFRSFADHMVENTHGALIQALESVIADFNDKLTTQFGDNFKELNAAVGKTVEWQDRYREHVESLEARIERTLQAIENGERAMAAVERSASAIPEAIDPLRPTLITVADTLGRINEDLEAYADLHDKARDAFPLVNANLDSITTRLSTTIGSMIERTETTLEGHENAHKALEEGYARIRAQAEDSRDIFSEAVEDTMNHVGELLKKAAETSTSSMRETLAATDRLMKEQITQLDDESQEVLTRIIDSMAKNLGGISDRLASSYEGLADRLVKFESLVPASAPQHQRGEVGQHVARVGQQRERARDEPTHNLRPHESARQDGGDEDRAFFRAPRFGRVVGREGRSVRMARVVVRVIVPGPHQRASAQGTMFAGGAKGGRAVQPRAAIRSRIAVAPQSSRSVQRRWWSFMAALLIRPGATGDTIYSGCNFKG